MFDIVKLFFILLNVVWLCSTMFNFFRLCLTMLNFVLLCETLFDFVYLTNFVLVIGKNNNSINPHLDILKINQNMITKDSLYFSFFTKDKVWFIFFWFGYGWYRSSSFRYKNQGGKSDLVKFSFLTLFHFKLLTFSK